MYPVANENDLLQDEMTRLARRSRFKRNFILLIVVLLFIVASMFFSWHYGKKQAESADRDEINDLKNTVQTLNDKISELESQPAVVTPVSPIIDLQVLYSRIENISELATIEYPFTDAAQFSDSKHFLNWNVPGTKKSFILKWNGTIKAGVDLQQVKLKLLDTESADANAAKTIAVYIPSAKILSYEVDNNSVEVLDESSNIFNPITINDKVSFDSATEDSMKARFAENGLLEKAQQNAETILKQLILFDPEIEENYTVKFFITY